MSHTIKKNTGYLYPINKDNKWGYIDSLGNIIVTPQFDKVTDYFIAGYSEFELNGKHGFIDSTGHIAVPAEYEELTYFYKGLAWAKKNNHWGAINNRNNIIIPFDYDTISGNMEIQPMLIKESGKWIYIDQSGKQVFKQDYDEANVFSGPLALAKRNGLYGYIDKKGNWVIPAESEEADHFREGEALVFQKGNYYIIDTLGNKKLKIPSNYAELSNTGFVKISSDTKWGVINTKGNIIVDTLYNELSPYFVDGYSWGWKNGRCFIISDKGKTIQLPEIDKIWMFKSGVATFRKGHQYGFCDTTGRMVMMNISVFSEGLAAASENSDIKSSGLYGYIDFSGKLIIPYQFSQAFPFRYGLAHVEIDGKMAYINKTGKIIWQEK
jgi:hypothetical protein